MQYEVNSLRKLWPVTAKKNQNFCVPQFYNNEHSQSFGTPPKNKTAVGFNIINTFTRLIWAKILTTLCLPCLHVDQFDPYCRLHHHFFGYIIFFIRIGGSNIVFNFRFSSFYVNIDQAEQFYIRYIKDARHFWRR